MAQWLSGFGLDILWRCYFPQRCERDEFSCFFLPLAGMHGEQTGLILGNLCYAMSYQPAGLPCDAGKQEGLCLAAPPASDRGWFPCCAFLRRSPSRAERCSLFPSDFCGIENFSTAGQPPEPAWSLAGVGVSSTWFLHFSSELTQQDIPGWRSIYRLPSHIVKKTQHFPAPCKLGYLLGHYFKPQLHSLWCLCSSVKVLSLKKAFLSEYSWC